MGLLLEVNVTGADVQDRDGGVELLGRLRAREGGRVCQAVVDAGYRGEKVTEAAGDGIDVLVVTRKKGQEGFEVQPIRWIVERTFAWISQCRRLFKDVEKTVASSRAMILLAMTRLMAARLAG